MALLLLAYWFWRWFLLFSLFLLFRFYLLLFLLFLQWNFCSWYFFNLLQCFVVYRGWLWYCSLICKYVSPPFSIVSIFTEKTQHFIPYIIRHPISVLRITISIKLWISQLFIQKLSLPNWMSIIFNIIN